MPNNVFYLTGFMGVGKSTIGPILANTLGLNFIDLDEYIEKSEGKKIKDIFTEKGEEYFRKVEAELLRDASKQSNIIIALGGGAAVQKENIDFIKNNGKMIYLKASESSLLKRLFYKRNRPLLNKQLENNPSKEEVKEMLVKLISEREPFYKKADLVVDTEKTPVGKTVDFIARMIEKKFLT